MEMWSAGLHLKKVKQIQFRYTEKANSDGELIVRRASPDAHLLATSAAKVSESDRLWWQERIVRAWQSGANDLVSPSVKEAVEQ